MEPQKFVNTFGAPLALGDIVVFQHKTQLTFQNRGAARYIRAKIIGFTQKMIKVQWIQAQQLENYDNSQLQQPPHTHTWFAVNCVLVPSNPGEEK